VAIAALVASASVASAASVPLTPAPAGAPSRVDPAGLPPIACVEAIRAARIARDAGDAAKARTQLEAAVELSGCELPALAAMLPLLRLGAFTPDRTAALRQRLADRLANPASEIPSGLLTHLVHLPSTAADDDLMLGALERRLAAPETKAPTTFDVAELLEATADLQQRRGRPDAARDTLARLLALRPTDPLRWRALFLDLQLQRWATAADVLAVMVDSPEAPVFLRETYVSVLARLGRLDEVTAQLAKLVPPPSPGVGDLPTSRYAQVLLDAAWGLRDAGREADAQATFRRVLAYDPNQAEAQLALLHFYGTKEERATQAAAVAARRESETDPLALFEEGSDLLGAGDLEGARSLLARAAPQLDGTDYAEPAWYNLGTAAFKLERWDEAARAFAAAVTVNPTRVESHFKRGIALFHLERCGDAVAALRRTLELQPDKRDAHFYLAGCYAKLGDAAAAARENALFNAKG
jgi:tetratricopeptide (TPR) repeat protein